MSTVFARAVATRLKRGSSHTQIYWKIGIYDVGMIFKDNREQQRGAAADSNPAALSLCKGIERALSADQRESQRVTLQQRCFLESFEV